MERVKSMAEGNTSDGNDATAAEAPSEARIVLKADCYAIQWHLML